MRKNAIHNRYLISIKKGVGIIGGKIFTHLNCQDLTLKDFLKEFLQIKTIIKVFKRADPNFECISEVFRKLSTLVFVTKDLP